MTENGHAYIFSGAMVSKKGFDGLPGDLQGIDMATARQAQAEVLPWSIDFLVSQRKAWTEEGGEVINLSAADQAELMKRRAPLGDGILKTKAEPKPLWEMLLAAAKRDQ